MNEELFDYLCENVTPREKESFRSYLLEVHQFTYFQRILRMSPHIAQVENAGGLVSAAVPFQCLPIDDFLKVLSLSINWRKRFQNISEASS